MTVESSKTPVTPKTPIAVSSSAADSGADSGGDDAELKGQIDFLNSVIVDMQRKNDDLKAKMELYEAAGIVDTADAADMVCKFQRLGYLSQNASFQHFANTESLKQVC